MNAALVNRPLLLATAVALLLLAAACHDTGSVKRPGGDGAADRGALDARVDLPMPDRATADMLAPDAPAADLTATDLPGPDAVAPDLPTPDMPKPDLAPPDLAQPDSATADSAVTDLAPPDAGIPDATVPKPPLKGVCSPDKWCWVHPLPQGFDINGMWGASPTDLFMSTKASVMKYDGAAWKQMPRPYGGDIFDLWGSSATDVWVAMPHNASRFDGSKWTGLSLSKAYYCGLVWGTSATSVYFACGPESYHRLNGKLQKLTNPVSGNLKAFWAIPSSGIYASTPGGHVLHHKGTGNTWTDLKSTSTSSISALWGISSTGLYAFGKGGAIHKYDGSSWSTETSPTTNTLIDAWGDSPSSIFAVGAGGTVVHHDGSAWKTQVSGTTGDLHEVWGSGPSDVWAGGKYGTLIHYDGKTWSKKYQRVWSKVGVLDIWGSSHTDLFAVGSYGTIHHLKGDTWSAMKSGTSQHIYEVWGASSSEVYALAGGGAVLHYDGNKWTPHASHCTYPSTSSVRGLWGAKIKGQTVLYTVNGRYLVRHLPGAIWSCTNTDTQPNAGAPANLVDVWGVGPTDLYAVGATGTIVHFDGTSWKPQYTGVTYTLKKVWGSGNARYALADKKLLAWVLGKWVELLSASTDTFMNIGGTGPNDVCVVGKAAVYCYGGTKWDHQLLADTGTKMGAYAVWGSPWGRIYVGSADMAVFGWFK